MNTVCEAVERAFKNKNKSCLICYNFKLIQNRLHCVYSRYKTGGISTVNAGCMINDARSKAKDCKEYDGEY